MRERKTWEEFRESGLLWWINRIIHTFGWCITVTIDEDTKKVSGCYPERCSFRGFGLESEEKGYEKVTKYMKDNSEQLYEELK